MSSRQPRKPSTQGRPVIQHSRGPRHSNSASATRIEPHPESTMFGLQMQKVGFLGEQFINEWLWQNLGNDCKPTSNWTSRNRNNAYPQPPFVDREKDYANFTYRDSNGKLARLLTKFIPHDIEKWSSNPPVFHLEVKSTSEDCNEPFFMSDNQVQKARAFTTFSGGSSIPTDVYALIRVYHLEVKSKPDFTIYFDPWALYLAGKLDFLARDNYAVTPSTQNN